MEPKDLPAHIKAKVDEWLGEGARIRHFWQFDETFIVLAHIAAGTNFYCLRIFPVGNSLQLSQDNVLYPVE